MSLQDDLAAIDPEDFDALSRTLEKHVGEDDAGPKAGEDEAGKGGDKQGDSAAAPAGGNGGATPDTTTQAKDPDGVLLKDGKTVAPYGVLKGARDARHIAEERARQAEAKAQELSEALERMQAEAATRQPGDKPSKQAQTDAALFSEEDLASMAENFPEMAKLVKGFTAQAQVIAELQQQVAATKATPTQAPAPSDNGDDPESKVQKAINERPMLSKWQDKGGIAWDAALKVDDELRSDPAWKGKPLSERLVEVEKRVADSFGIELTPPAPPAPAPASKAGAPTPPAPRVEHRDVETLSDFSGRPPVTEADAVAGMPALALREKLDGMSEEQIDRWLARMG